MTTKFISYAGESSKVRFWQDAALAALQGLIVSRPAPTLDVDDPAFHVWKREVCVASMEVAEKMWQIHGPSHATVLEGEDPFQALGAPAEGEA